MPVHPIPDHPNPGTQHTRAVLALTTTNNTIDESIDMVITNEKNRQSSVVIRRKVVFDYQAFNYLLNVPEGKGKRNQDFLNVAAKLLNQHPLLYHAGAHCCRPA